MNAYLQSKQDQCRTAISKYEKDKKRLVRAENDISVVVMNLKAKLMHLKDFLMHAQEESSNIQHQFSQQYETVLASLCSEKTALYATYVTQVHPSFSHHFCQLHCVFQIRDLLNGFNTGVNAVALSAFERYQLEGDIDQGVETGRFLLSDKEGLIAALQNSQDFKVNQIDTIEEDLLQKENSMLQRTTQALLLDEKRRSRDRVTEILHYIERNVMEVEALSHTDSPNEAKCT